MSEVVSLQLLRRQVSVVVKGLKTRMMNWRKNWKMNLRKNLRRNLKNLKNLKNLTALQYSQVLLFYHLRRKGQRSWF